MTMCEDTSTHVILVEDLRPDDKPDGRKLICSSMQKMFTSSIENTVVNSMFSNILPFCGQSGYEVVRVGGTNGLVIELTMQNLLAVLYHNERLLSNKGGACLIIKCKKYFFIFYTKNQSSDGEHEIAYIKYRPPQ